MHTQCVTKGMRDKTLEKYKMDNIIIKKKPITLEMISYTDAFHSEHSYMCTSYSNDLANTAHIPTHPQSQFSSHAHLNKPNFPHSREFPSIATDRPGRIVLHETLEAAKNYKMIAVVRNAFTIHSVSPPQIAFLFLIKGRVH